MSKVAATEQYLNLRQAGDVEGIIALVSNNIYLESNPPIGGSTICNGKDELREYLIQNPGNGTWEPIQEDGNTTKVKGVIKYLVFTFNAEATFTFDGELISSIVVNLTAF